MRLQEAGAFDYAGGDRSIAAGIERLIEQRDQARAQIATLQAERDALIAARDTMGNLWASAKAERDALREALWLLVQAHDHGCGIADQIVNARAALENRNG